MKVRRSGLLMGTFMLLKSLELQGYKTFAGRTVFEFADTITAIVGPNGSGKSNIADSMRWVLGEQSYRLLRGKKTVDMIFSGSDQRARSGMASVTILFDNSSGWLPIDFSEVAITRRAYRDGQNEYLVNGQRVRLKDVSDLLGKSGLSERTYTIIGQGLVDAALALKAEDRRVLFEEAAGIGLYRSRKKEAIKRLESTQRNLERVEDILTELHPRVRSLERQAKRAQEYEQVQKDLHILLRDWYGYHWFLAQREVNAARKRLKKDEQLLQIARQKEEKFNKKLSLDRYSVQDLRQKLSTMHQEISNIHTERESIARKIAVLDERNRSVMVQLNTTNQESSRLENQLNEYQLRLNEKIEEHEKLLIDLNEARENVRRESAIISSLKRKTEALVEKINSIERKRSDIKDHISRLKINLSENNTQISRYKKEIEEIKSQLLTLEKDHVSNTKIVEQAKKALKDSQQAKKIIEGALGQQKIDIERLEEERKRIINELSRRERESAKYRTQLSLLDQAENDLIDYAKGARVIVKYARDRKLKGMNGTLTSKLIVPEVYETAIASALGEYIDAILMDSRNLSQDTLNILNKETARGVLLPLAEIVPYSKLPSFKDKDGIIGIASDLVTAKAEYLPAIELLLGQVLVVESRENVQAILSELPQTAKVVTLNGEIFHANGPIIAGVSGERTKLSRPRQRIEIERKIKELSKSINEHKKRVEHLDSQLSEKIQKNRELNDDLVQANKKVQSSEGAYQKALLAFENTERQKIWHQKRLLGFQNEISTLNEEITKSREEMIQATSTLTELEASLEEYRKQRESLTMDEYLERESFWKAQLAFDEKSLAQFQALKEERETEIVAMRSSLDLTYEKIRQLKLSLERVEQEKTELKNRERELFNTISALQEKVNPLEEELKSVESGQIELLEIESQARKDLNMAERQYSQSQMNLTRKQENLDNLRERIESDFGLVDYEYAKQISGPTPLPFEGLVEKLPVIHELSDDLEPQIKDLRYQLRRMRSVNPDARDEYREVKQRYEFMKSQVEDLKKAEADIRAVISELDELMEKDFRKTFEAVSVEFKEIFTRLFGGGVAKLVLTDPDNLIESGIDIEARLPGRRIQGLSLLSGGERSLTAVSLIFALLRISPTPFCVLDEVDAMLDETNVGRFRDLIKELSDNTQFIVITHNRNTVQAADVIYGVTMGSDSSSQVISLKLDQVAEVV